MNMYGQRLKLCAAALLIALLTGGCRSTTVYRATAEDTRDLSPAQARKLLIQRAQRNVGNCDNPGTVNVTFEKITGTCGSSTWAYYFANNPALAAVLRSEYQSGCVNASGRGGFWSVKDCMFLWQGQGGHAAARDFVRAWYVLARAGAVDPEKEAAFEREAESYRAAPVKPQLPEAAVKYKVQAELAVKQLRFDDAADLYDQALVAAPWWPAGHYNRGLILGELKDYQGGIRALQKYLRLEPAADNSRAVQLKIYEWESLVPRAGK